MEPLTRSVTQLCIESALGVVVGISVERLSYQLAREISRRDAWDAAVEVMGEMWLLVLV
jgi:hypothetical protein